MYAEPLTYRDVLGLFCDIESPVVLVGCNLYETYLEVALPLLLLSSGHNDQTVAWDKKMEYQVVPKVQDNTTKLARNGHE